MDNDARMLGDILSYYENGKSLSDIASKCDISIWYLKKVLDDFKESCRINKKMYSKDLKVIIANRDNNGVSRRSISKELGVSESLISASCELFGQATKKQTSINSLYTQLVGCTNLDACPSCGKKRIRRIEDGRIERLVENKDGTLTKKMLKTDGIYCLDCSNEFFYFTTDNEQDRPIYMLNWEYL